MRPTVTLLLHALIGPLLFAAAPRIGFIRTIPAVHDLGGAEVVTIVSAIGDSEKIETFLDVFSEKVNDSGVLRVRNAIGGRRTEEAGVDLRVRAFTCTVEEKSGEVGGRDEDQKRIRRKQHWADARCSARVDISEAKSGQRRVSFSVKGEGTSPRVGEVSDDERNIALEQAARYAALDAAERITPRRIRETIPLDETAPDFEDAMALINAGELAEARKLWERALRVNARSAPLRYNLGALCEAMADRASAEGHYIAARELAPGERRYLDQLRSFLTRK